MQEIEIRSGVIKPIECAKEAYELIKSDYWLLFAIWLVGAMIGGISLFIAAGAMMCGTFYCFLRKIDGYPISFDDLWKGMQWFLPGLIVMLFIVVPILIVYGIIYIPILMAAAMGTKLSPDEFMAMFAGALMIDLVFVVIMVCFHTLLIFSFPLIVDKNLGAFKAMTTSARAVFKNFGGVGGLIGVNFLLGVAGYAAFCVGIYFVVPILIATNVVAYRRIFPGGNAGRFDPPPPVVYGGGTA